MVSEGEVIHDNNNTVKPLESIAKTNKQTKSTTTFGENNDNHNKLVVKLNMHSKEDKSLCTCSKQVTIHVVIVVLALLTFLGIGILLGYFIGKPEKYTGKLKNSIVAKFTW